MPRHIFGITKVSKSGLYLERIRSPVVRGRLGLVMRSETAGLDQKQDQEKHAHAAHATGVTDRQRETARDGQNAFELCQF